MQRLAITDEASPLALLSAQTISEDSSAPRRRLAGGGATQQLPGSAAGSLARWHVASPPSRHGCRAPRVLSLPPTATRFAVPAVSWYQDARMPTCLGRPVRVLRQRPRVQRPRVQCPASGTCPASARPVSARPVSARPVSARPMSGVRCPVSSARCPVRASGIRVQLSAPVNSWSAWMRQAATGLGTGRVG